MIQKVPEGIDSKFRYVLLVARRAEQLIHGSRPKLEVSRPTKPTRLAQREFEENVVLWGRGPEGGILELETEAGETGEDLIGGSQPEE